MLKLKVNQTDKLFSLVVRERDKFTCQRCGKSESGPSPYIHCAHFYGRKGLSTRFDLDNAVALCGTIGFPGGCHGYFSEHPYEFVEFMKKRLGEKRFNSLVIRAHTPTKIDETILRIGFKKMLTDLKSNSIIGAR